MRATHSSFETTLSAEISGTDVAYWTLRIGAAMCFIGHGAFGFITKAAWIPYFGVVGIPEAWAWTLMPIIGAVDVTAGMWVLFAPRGFPLVYMAVWALWTALLRPLSGDSAFEAVERAGNYGVPFALLMLTAMPRVRVGAILKWTTALLLAGHGALGAINGKAMLATHYATIGLPPTTTAFVGWFEIALAIAVLIRPAIGLLLFVAAWKVATESLFVVAGAPIWEFVERGGSYAAPVALAAMMRSGFTARVAKLEPVRDVALL
jgi:hypothetical protein